MEMEIAYYWQEINKNYSNIQVFLLLSYWTLAVYQREVEGREVPETVEEWRSCLFESFKESSSYDMKESVLGLSQRIEWAMLERDKTIFRVLMAFSDDIKNFFAGASCIDTPCGINESIIKRLQYMMNEILQMADAHLLCSMTPDSIKRVVAGLAGQADIDNMVDLCCGSGGLGIAVWEQLREPWKVAYCGIDIDPIMVDLCTIMTYLCRMPESTVVLQDVLWENENKAESIRKYDFALLDVPRGQNKNTQIKGHVDWLGDIRQKNFYSDWLYIMRMLNVLGADGEGIVIVTSGTLTRKNEAALREMVISADWVEAVITLPANLYPNTRVGSELIVFHKAKEKERRGKILFIDISGHFYRDNRNFYSITENGIRLVTELFQQYREKQGISRIVNVSQVEKESWSLKPLRYIQTGNYAENTMFCLKDVAEITRGVQLRKEEEEALALNGTAYYLNIKDIQDGSICFEGARMIRPKSMDWDEKFRIREDDILITSKGTLLKIAIVGDSPPEAYICGNLTLLRVDKERYHPYILYEFLISEEGIRALESIQSGTTIRVLNNANLEGLRIPSYDQKMMFQVGNRLQESRRKYEAERRRLTDQYTMKRRKLLESVGIKP